ncbi:Metallo-dependent phosphatase-like protein [Annulohypoxylon maeteangense]|uniref:Metallo-dependent phosphatase-like protein n=1 Tax=Annulohypoxylon maeteangense TaxID=1927788 RepID=UPI00200785BE|nr:Metallo-dependent phosphatase-like protein [Annulohypoxylon maeteangense]KAI0890252.1 Metallo-dependent phosphatase-like protein [Annulohypoxylon maeteangense]
MAVQILSDLHLETPKAYDIFSIAPKAPYLALLGDIGNVALHKDECLAFLSRQLKNFRAVLFVPGNHEAYHSNWPETLDVLRAFERDVRNDNSIGDFVLLDRVCYQIPDTNVVILGCSLFSYIPAESRMAVSFGLNDFYTIEDWDVDLHNEAHERDLAWLDTQVAELEQSDVRIMIFTHWSPSKDDRTVDPKHATSSITSAFSTDLSEKKCWTSSKVVLWASGHTHYNCDFTVERNDGAGPLRLLANQRGYFFAQADGFDEEKVIEI